MVLKKVVNFFMGGLILSLIGCSASTERIPVTGEDQTPGAETSLANTRWKLVSYGEPGSEILVMDSTDVTMQFEDGSKAGGNGGCNKFGAEYEVSEGNQLSMSEVVSTLVACNDEALMEQETQYLDRLRAADSFELSGGSLIIRYGDEQGALVFSRITSNIPNTVNL